MPHLVLDHIVVPVDSVAAASRRWRDAGFDVRAGGRHEGVPTENALVPVASGSYVELIGPTRTTLRPRLRTLAHRGRWPSRSGRHPALAARFLDLLAAPGRIADCCVAARPLAALAEQATSGGLVVAGPLPMGRRRPDGTRLAWHLALPVARWLPFAIEDLTDAGLRIPTPASAHDGWHLVRARRVQLAVPSLDEATIATGCWLGRDRSPNHPAPVFVLDDGCEVELHEAPTAEGVGVVDVEYEARRGAISRTWRLSSAPA